MNNLFLPNEDENKLIQIIQKYWRNEFALIRMTVTMLNKSIIDASEEIRLILRDENIVDYKKLRKREKVIKPSIIITPYGIIENNTSLYRPNTKDGDPRFWVYSLGKVVSPHTLVYFSVHDSKIIAIPLVDHSSFENSITSFFGSNDGEEKIVDDFRTKIQTIKNKGWVLSVSPNRLNDKDIGETLERELGVKINNLKTPDYEGKIEVKGKTLGSKTMDSLFSMVPNWEISPVSSVNEIALLYGYPDNEYIGYKALFVTVNTKPNNQGLFLEVDEENELIIMKCLLNNVITDVCSWKFKDVEKRLYAKHPKTMWIIAEKKKIDGKYHFRYLKVQYTHSPIFTQFLLLIKQNLIVFDWRRRADIGAKVKISKSKMDYGHGFRMDSSRRKLLFGETIDFEL